MDTRIRTALWALAGLALAVGISLTAFAVAGGSIGDPAGPVRVVPTLDEERKSLTPEPTPTRDPSETPDPTHTVRSTTSSSTAAPTPSDDHGGSGPGDGGSHDGSDD